VKYRIFNTEAEAIEAEAAISEVQPDVLTVRWAIPVQISDGRWVFPSPDDKGVEAAPDWWPSE
jgi:hypothetical protein